MLRDLRLRQVGRAVSGSFMLGFVSGKVVGLGFWAMGLWVSWMRFVDMLFIWVGRVCLLGVGWFGVGVWVGVCVLFAGKEC